MTDHHDDAIAAAHSVPDAIFGTPTWDDPSANPLADLRFMHLVAASRRGLRPKPKELTVSYDVRVVNEEGETPEVELAEFSRGGTYLAGAGPVPASLNVTYNYTRRVSDAAAWLTQFRHGMITKERPPATTGLEDALLTARLQEWSLVGARALTGRQLRASIPELWWLTMRLGGRDVRPSFTRDPGEAHADYWADTSDNVGHALAVLLSWAEQFPEARWEVS